MNTETISSNHEGTAEHDDVHIVEFDDAGFDMDAVTPLQIYRAEVRCGNNKVIGPVYPIDEFVELDRNLLESAVRKSLLRSHSIGGRLYVNGRDVRNSTKWTGNRVFCPQTWQQDLEQVTAALSGIDDLDESTSVDLLLPFHPAGKSEPTRIGLQTAQDEIQGPIAPITYFSTDLQQVLSWCAREGRITCLSLEGTTYVSYSDVYGRLLSNYFEENFDHRAAWDGTYGKTWSSWRLVTGDFVKPRGFKDAVRSDVLPRIDLSRQSCRVNDKGEPCFLQAAYPNHVADQAAKMFRALYRECGFLERFRQYCYYDVELDAGDSDRVEPLSSFGPHEVELFREFVEEGALRVVRYDREEYIVLSDLIYYDMFAAKIVEDQLGLDVDVKSRENRTVQMMFDGTFSHGSPFRVPTPLRCKQDVVTTG